MLLLDCSSSRSHCPNPQAVTNVDKGRSKKRHEVGVRLPGDPGASVSAQPPACLARAPRRLLRNGWAVLQAAWDVQSHG